MQSSPPILFDRSLLRKRRARRSADFARADFLHREAAASVAESLSYITRAFPTIVELGAQGGLLRAVLEGRAGTTCYLACDAIAEPGLAVVVDEEKLPFAENSVDAVVSVLALQWVNDLPGTLAHDGGHMEVAERQNVFDIDQNAEGAGPGSQMARLALVQASHE